MLRRLLKTALGRGTTSGAARDRLAPEAMFAAAVKSWDGGDLAAAEQQFRAIVAVAPDLAPAWANLGQVLRKRGRPDEATACLERAVRLAPENPAVALNHANLLALNGRLEDAARAYAALIERHPGFVRGRANALKVVMDLCDWSTLDGHVAEIEARWREDRAVAGEVVPFVSLLAPFSPQFVRDVATAASSRIQAAAALLPRPTRAARIPDRRLRIGYASADFRDHATSHLIAGLFEQHDRARFEVFAYSFGADDRSAYRGRIASGVDHFVELTDLAFAPAAQRIADDALDVLVDLNAHTGGGRLPVFALRPCPVQVNYLGYPGTSGASFLDYIVGDHVVLPDEDRCWYTEAIARLPSTYQVNDDRQPIYGEPVSRAEEGLPEGPVVLCCFNNHAKIERRAFSAWMKILSSAPDSVLWLMSGPGEAHLRTHAAAAEVDPNRLLFARRAPKPRHLARLRLADLVLDTYFYNAHTTASDALWASVPVLTCPSDRFAGRVAASLLRAVGLPELIASNHDEYAAIAIELVRSPGKRAELQERLATLRGSAPLFATAGFAREVEAAFVEMADRRLRNEPPSSFDVPPRAAAGQRPG